MTMRFHRRACVKVARVAVVACVALVLASCGDALTASWVVRFESEGGATGADAVRVRLRVLSGDCASTAVVYQADVARLDPVPLFGEIGEGPLAFEATAKDASCTVIARGCTATSLPLAMGNQIVTRLEAVSGEPPLCAASACTNGLCAPGSMDAGIADGAARDAR